MIEILSPGARTAVAFRSPVIPVVSLPDIASTLAAARAIAEGGGDIVEITLRNPAAVEAIRAVAEAVPGLVVAAGTVLTAAQVDEVHAAGATLVVSPGTAAEVLDRAAALGLAAIPGVATPTEAMAVAARGYRLAKFFPAVPAGGTGWLKAVGSVLPDLAYCPTGGVTAENLRTFLALPNVVAIGGSWITADPDPAAIAAAMADALARAGA